MSVKLKRAKGAGTVNFHGLIMPVHFDENGEAEVSDEAFAWMTPDIEQQGIIATAAPKKAPAKKAAPKKAPAKAKKEK